MPPRTVTFQGEPLSTQHIYGSNGRGGRFLKPEAKAAKEAYMWEAKMQWKVAPYKAISLSASSFFQNRRRRDWDNLNKLTMDALNGIAYDDDSQICEAHVYRAYDAHKPRIEVTVYEA